MKIMNGSKVLLRDDLVEGNMYGSIIYAENMLKGCTVVVKDADKNGFSAFANGQLFYYSNQMINLKKQ